MRVDVAVLVEVRVVVLRQVALRGVGRAERAAQQVVARLGGLRERARPAAERDAHEEEPLVESAVHPV